MVIKSHNFAPFRRFDGTLLSYVRQSTRLRTNPSRTPKIHQNSDFLGILGTPYKSDDAMFLPVGKSDAPCGAMYAFGTLSETTYDNFYIFYVQVGGNYETYTLL